MWAGPSSPASERFDTLRKRVVDYPTVPGPPFSRTRVGLGPSLGSDTMRTLVTLACTDCKRRNYTTKKNKQNNPERIELKKYCKWCRCHTVHKETR